MSTTVTYKGDTLTTVNNQTRTLLTSGKYLEDDITLTDVSQSVQNVVITIYNAFSEGYYPTNATVVTDSQNHITTVTLPQNSLIVLRNNTSYAAYTGVTITDVDLSYKVNPRYLYAVDVGTTDGSITF